MKNQIKIIATEAFSSLVKDAMGPISLEQFATKSKISKIHLKRLLEGTLVETHRCIIRAIIDSSDGRITEEHASRVLNYNDWLFRGE